MESLEQAPQIYERSLVSGAVRYGALIGTMAIANLGGQLAKPQEAHAVTPEIAEYVQDGVTEYLEDTFEDVLLTDEKIKELNEDLIAPSTLLRTKTKDTDMTDKDCSWLTNEPSGYVTGTACKEDLVKVLHVSDSGSFVYGPTSVNGRVSCAWSEKGALQTWNQGPKQADNECEKQYITRNDRYTFGKNFNCGVSKCVAGSSAIELTEQCDGKFYRNFASKNPSFFRAIPRGKSGLYSYVNKQTDPVSYRYTIRQPDAKGNYAVVVRSKELGWGMMDRDCIEKPPIGDGPKKHGETVAGPNPNAGRDGEDYAITRSGQ